jgi:large subunit ribosomal protein L19
VSRNAIIEKLETECLKKEVPQFQVGDTVRVHTKIVEGNKERIQVYEGIVIGRQGKGLSETFAVYRNAYGSSMEKVFLLHSPRVVKVEVMRSGRVRRAKLYYLRGKTGKQARLKERFIPKGKATLKKMVAPVEEKAPEAKEEKPKAEVKAPETKEAKPKAKAPEVKEEKLKAEAKKPEAEEEKPSEPKKKEEDK